MKLGYTLLYVDDVEATMKFYSEAFGLAVKFLHDSKDYGEMVTDDTTLGFVGHETASSHGFEYKRCNKSDLAPGFELGFVTHDVASAYNRAIKAGAEAASPPSLKPWGQTVSYVRDCNGFLVEICSPMG